MQQDWLDEETAQLYDSYEQNFCMYQAIAEKLVLLADLRPNMTVVDLACGTGTVLGLILEHLDGSNTVIGIDFSTPMLRHAQSRYPTVHFLSSKAENIYQILPHASVDTILCNSAFWMFSQVDALRAIHQVLKPGGHFLFNLPDFMFTPRSFELSSLLSLMSSIAKEEYGYMPTLPPPCPLNHEAVQKLLADTDFTCIKYEDHNPGERDAQQTYALRRIPTLTSWLYPQLNYHQRMKLLEKAYERYDKTLKESNQWRYYLIQKGASLSQSSSL